MPVRMRWADRGAVAALVGVVLEAVALVTVRSDSPFGGTLASVGVLAGVLAGTAVAGYMLTGRAGRAWHVATRLGIWVAIVVSAVALADRAKTLFGPTGNPSGRLEEPVSDFAATRLSPDLRLRWALRVAAHAFSTRSASDSVLDVPATWPFPAGVRLVLMSSRDSVDLVATTEGGNRACRFALHARVDVGPPPAGRHDPIHCSPAADVAGAGRPLAVRRTSWTPPALPPPRREPVDAWTQYRHDAARTGRATSGSSGAAAWASTLDGELRSTPSVIGGRVLAGTHGPGALYAVDLATGATRWMRYLANWVHQDAVSDGSTVIVGFGDNDRSLFGQSPSGVSAFSIETGALRWSVFEGNSVMTSPVLWRDRTAYITSGGTLKLRDQVTGTELGRIRLPGRATMAPPALRGDTMVASLDSALVCAVKLSGLETLWCAELPDAGMAGHSAAAIVGDRVLMSTAILGTGLFGISSRTWYRLKSVFWLTGADDSDYVGQRIWALDLATGRVAWQSSVYPSRRSPAGHTSGTPVAIGQVGAVVLPLSGLLVAFDLATGRELWTRTSGGSRGPVAVAGDQFVMTPQSGGLEVLQSRTGVVRCSIPASSARFDRAGPALADSTLLFGSQSGQLVALPLGACDTAAFRRLLP